MRPYDVSLLCSSRRPATDLDELEVFRVLVTLCTTAAAKLFTMASIVLFAFLLGAPVCEGERVGKADDGCSVGTGVLAIGAVGTIVGTAVVGVSVG